MTNRELDALLRRIGGGDKSALAALYEGFRMPVYYYALRLTGNPQKAEDVMQETFLAILRNGRNYRSDGKAAAWIYTVARNKAMDMFRKEGNELPLSQAEELEAVSSPFDGDAYPGMLSVLNEKERDIVILRVLCGFTLTEIARDKEMPKGRVFWSYNNAMKKLKKHLKEEGESNV